MFEQYAGLVKINQHRWDAAVFDHAHLTKATPVAARLSTTAARAAYSLVSQKTGVPWDVIAVIHEREASQSWKANLAQGDPWNRVSIHVPKGRGPFASWVDAAVDALTNCGPYAAKWKDWSMGGILTILELYNGLGYENNHHEASPYCWAGTQWYTKGKYIADGHFDEDVVDEQLGCAVILKQMGR